MTDRKGKKEGKFIASALFFLKPHDLDLQKAINRYYINSIQLWSTIFCANIMTRKWCTFWR